MTYAVVKRTPERTSVVMGVYADQDDANMVWEDLHREGEDVYIVERNFFNNGNHRQGNTV